MPLIPTSSSQSRFTTNRFSSVGEDKRLLIRCLEFLVKIFRHAGVHPPMDNDYWRVISAKVKATGARSKLSCSSVVQAQANHHNNFADPSVSSQKVIVYLYFYQVRDYVWIHTDLTLATYWFTWRHSPEKHNLNCHCSDALNLISVWNARPMARLFIVLQVTKRHSLTKSPFIGISFLSLRVEIASFPFQTRSTFHGSLPLGDHYLFPLCTCKVTMYNLL